MSAHTPGPWRVVDRSEMGSGGGTYRVVSGDGDAAVCVASLSGWDACRTEADARLIALAPTLTQVAFQSQEAAKAIAAQRDALLVAAVGVFEVLAQESFDEADIDAAREALDAAIAKARGK